MHITITSGDAHLRDPHVNAHRPENMDAVIISGEPPTVVVTLSGAPRGGSLFIIPAKAAAVVELFQHRDGRLPVRIAEATKALNISLPEDPFSGTSLILRVAK